MDAGILLAVHDQERCPGLFDVVDGTPLQKELPVIPGSLASVDEEHLVRDVGAPRLGNLVRNAHEHHTDREAVSVFGGAPRKIFKKMIEHYEQI